MSIFENYFPDSRFAYSIVIKLLTKDRSVFPEQFDYLFNEFKCMIKNKELKAKSEQFCKDLDIDPGIDIIEE